MATESQTYEVTVAKAKGRRVALRGATRAEADAYAAKVNAGKVRGESTALVAPTPGSAAARKSGPKFPRRAGV